MYPTLHYQPRRWYGYQVVLSDAGALGLGVLASALSDGSDYERQGDLVAITWGAGVVGAAAVHAAHRNGRFGLAGAGMRLALPPISALFGVAGNCLGKPDEPCSADGARWGFVVGVATAALLDAALFARARPVDEAQDTHRWYGWQTLLIDGAALATSIGIAAGQPDLNRSKTGAMLFVIPYTAGFLISPWVHAFHGRIGLAFASLGLRAIAPPLGAIAGIAGNCAASGSEPSCIHVGATYGIFFGTLLVAAIDIGLLSYERAPARESSARATIAPFITPIRGGISAGIGGTL